MSNKHYITREAALEIVRKRFARVEPIEDADLVQFVENVFEELPFHRVDFVEWNQRARLATCIEWCNGCDQGVRMKKLNDDDFDESGEHWIRFETFMQIVDHYLHKPCELCRVELADRHPYEFGLQESRYACKRCQRHYRKAALEIFTPEVMRQWKSMPYADSKAFRNLIDAKALALYAKALSNQKRRTRRVSREA